jgi:hypothetical protein
LLFDVDEDLVPDPLSVQSVTDPPNGAVVNNGTDVTYTPDADFYGTDSFSYTVSDGRGGTDTAAETVTVTAVDDLPVASDDTATTDEETLLPISVLANDNDPEGKTISVTNVFLVGTKGEANKNAAGTGVVYDPNGKFEKLGVGQTDTDVFQYDITDADGYTSRATVTPA